jgi:hypothetical protein
MSYVYREIPPPELTDSGSIWNPDDRAWAVGFYNPRGDWQTESTHTSKERAAERVHWLNGGADKTMQAHTNRVMEQLTNAIRNMPSTMRVRY